MTATTYTISILYFPRIRRWVLRSGAARGMGACRVFLGSPL